MNIHYCKSAMARRDKDQIKAQIAQAVVRVVAERGIGAASVGEIARAAKVSPGTIYLHYADKEDLLQQVYLGIKRDFHASLMAGAQGGSAQSIRQMWFALFDYLQAKPLAFLFLEYAGAAQVLSAAQRAEVAPLQDEVNAVLQAALDDGTLADLPLGVVSTLLLGPAMLLARRAAMAGEKAEISEISQTFDQVWLSIRAGRDS